MIFAEFTMKSDVALTIQIMESEIIFPQENFHETISFVLVFAQFFGIMPLHGMTSKSIQDVKFKWKSPRVIYALYNISGAFTIGGFCILKFAKDGLMLDKTGTMSFYVLNFFGALQFIQVSKNWNVILKEFAFVENSMRGYGSVINLKRKFKILTSIVMMSSLVEHLLFVSSGITLSMDCGNFLDFPGENYFSIAFPSVFTLIEYSHWKAALVEIANVLSTVVWNFTDLFIILISSSLAARFSQISKRLEINRTMHEKFWREIREDYNKLARLSRVVDNYLAPLVMISFVNNTFFICVQLYNSLKERSGIVETVYYFFSFGFLVGRTVAVSLYGAWINEESRRPLEYLHSIPSQYYCNEINRLTQQIVVSPVGMTGSRFFMLTRSFLLKMASTIVTFELMFLQFGPQMRLEHHPSQNQCYKGSVSL